MFQDEIKVKGRITNIIKQVLRDDCLIQGVTAEYQREIEKNPMIKGSNGTYLEIGEYLGTKLYFNVTIYDPLVFEVEGEKYRIPERIQLECYENVRKAIGHRVGPNLAIRKDDMEFLEKNYKGKKIDISFFNMKKECDGYVKAIVGLHIWFEVNNEPKCPFCGYVYCEKV